MVCDAVLVELHGESPTLCDDEAVEAAEVALGGDWNAERSRLRGASVNSDANSLLHKHKPSASCCRP